MPMTAPVMKATITQAQPNIQLTAYDIVSNCTLTIIEWLVNTNNRAARPVLGLAEPAAIAINERDERPALCPWQPRRCPSLRRHRHPPARARAHRGGRGE